MFYYSIEHTFYIVDNDFGHYWLFFLFLFYGLNVNGQQKDHIRKNIKIFKDIGFSIDTKTNSKVLDFLDITFNLNNAYINPIKNQTIDCYI